MLSPWENRNRIGCDLSGTPLPQLTLHVAAAGIFSGFPPIDRSISPPLFFLQREDWGEGLFFLSRVLLARAAHGTGPLNYLGAYIDLADGDYSWSWKRDSNAPLSLSLSLHVLVVQGRRWTTLRWSTRPGLISRSPHLWMSAKLASTTHGW